MKRPNFEPIFTEKSDYCEKSDPTPVETFVPHQSMSLAEMMRRFESGQRLNVHSSPMNTFYSSEEEANDNTETFNDAPPSDVYDIVDVERYFKEHKAHKINFDDRMKKKAQEAQRSKEKPAPGAGDNDHPDDPAK